MIVVEGAERAVFSAVALLLARRTAAPPPPVVWGAEAMDARAGSRGSAVEFGLPGDAKAQRGSRSLSWDVLPQQVHLGRTYGPLILPQEANKKDIKL
jgi:hypothetical protein